MKSIRIIFSLLISLLFITASAQNDTAKTSGKEKKDKDDPMVVLPVLVRGPYLQKATSKTILIRWRTDALSRSRVYFGMSATSLDRQITDSALLTEHKILLTGLQPDTRYFYSIG